MLCALCQLMFKILTAVHNQQLIIAYEMSLLQKSADLAKARAWLAAK